jgi:hypothetical protein
MVEHILENVDLQDLEDVVHHLEQLTMLAGQASREEGYCKLADPQRKGEEEASPRMELQVLELVQHSHLQQRRIEHSIWEEVLLPYPRRWEVRTKEGHLENYQHHLEGVQIVGQYYGMVGLRIPMAVHRKEDLASLAAENFDQEVQNFVLVEQHTPLVLRIAELILEVHIEQQGNYYSVDSTWLQVELNLEVRIEKMEAQNCPQEAPVVCWHSAQVGCRNLTCVYCQVSIQSFASSQQQMRMPTNISRLVGTAMCARDVWLDPEE